MSSLRFMVAGARGSGVRTVCDLLSRHDDVLCRDPGVFCADPDRRADAVRSIAHNLDVINLGVPNILEHWVLQDADRKKSTVGAGVYLDQLSTFDLWDCLTELTRSGDFCVIYVCRNPIACLASVQTHGQDSLAAASPLAKLSVSDVDSYCCQHEKWQRQLQQSCSDRLEIDYVDLVLRPGEVCQHLFEFLELSPRPDLKFRRTRRSAPDLPDRVINWKELKSSCAYYVRAHLQGEEA